MKSEQIIKKNIVFKDLFEIPMKNGLFKPTQIRGSGVKMVNMGEIFGHDRIFDIEMEYVPLTETERENALLKNQDLLFARASLAEDAGKCCIFLGIDETTFESHVIRVRINKKIADPRFYYYYFKSQSGKNLIYSIVEKTSASGIRGSDLAKLVVPFYDKIIQNKFSDYLETIDFLIENLIKTNHVLEKIIQSIFKSWFVDFDVVTEFVDSELGKIPKGWSVQIIDDLANITSGKRPEQISKIKSPEMNIPLYGSGGIMGYVSTPYFKEPIIITGRVGTIGILHLVDEPCFPSDNTIVIIPNNEEYLFLLLHQLKQIDFNSFISGSTQPLITQTNIKNEVIILPEKVILKKFHKFTKNVFCTISKNNYKINTLNNIRDSLLPKLMSGEIRV